MVRQNIDRFSYRPADSRSAKRETERERERERREGETVSM